MVTLADFAAVPFPSYMRVGTSPTIEADVFGVRIAMPPTVSAMSRRASRSPALPISGVLRLPDEALPRGSSPFHSIVVVAVNRATGAPTTFPLRPDKTLVPLASAPPDDVTELAEIPHDADVVAPIFDFYFNVDALMFCPDFPRAPAHYFVHALLGPWVSNVVEVEVEDT